MLCLESIMAQFRTSRTFDWMFVLGLLALVWVGYINRIQVTDWLYFQGHPLPSRVSQIVTSADLSPAGKTLLWRGDPVFTDAATIDQICDAERLGCLTEKGQIYVLDEPSNPEQTIVTAVHEMLHLAYRRLSSGDRDVLKTELEIAMRAHADDGLADDLSDLTNPDDRLDEAHAILGTEYADLRPALEQHYRTYFSTRTKIIEAQTAAETR